MPFRNDAVTTMDVIEQIVSGEFDILRRYDNKYLLCYMREHMYRPGDFRPVLEHVLQIARRFAMQVDDLCFDGAMLKVFKGIAEARKKDATENTK